MCTNLSKRIITFLVCALVVTMCSGQASAGLRAFYTFDDGTANDSSGNECHGLFVGDPMSVIDGELALRGTSSVLELGGPGTGDGVELPPIGGAQVLTVTFAMWIKSALLSGRKHLLTDIKPGEWEDSSIAWMAKGKQMFSHNKTETALVGSTTLEPDTWYHVAMVRDGTDHIIYVNGSEDARQPMNNQPLDLSSGFEMGFCPNNTNKDFKGRIDDVQIYDHALSQAEIQSVMDPAPELLDRASDPIPADEATEIPQDVVLSWMAGEFADKHDVYFGTNPNDVNNADRSNPLGVLVSQNHNINIYDPVSALSLGQTYYWRVDEVNAPPDYTIYKGALWQFTVEPVAYPIDGQNITASASSSNSAAQGPENTINDSGLDTDDLHSEENIDMWLSSFVDPGAPWIQYEFDKAYKLNQMLVWNHNSLTEPVVGFGIREATIEYSVDGANWTKLGTYEFSRAPGMAGYAANTTVDLGGVAAKYVKITANSNWGGIVSQCGLSEVRFFYIPLVAREPVPAIGSTDMDVDNVTLSWRAGREAASHNVYLSTDQQAVIDEAISAVSIPAGSSYVSYDTGELELGRNYYWKVNEVNEAEIPTTWQGDVWNFSTQEYLVVDDIEDYNDFEPDRIFDTWTDGWNVPTNGSQVSYTEPSFVEQTIVHGGKQSMPLHYNNISASYSEATANVANLSIGQDWTSHGIKLLSLWFYGDPANAAEQMYVKVNGSKVVYSGDVADIQSASWHEWKIDLASFGTNLSNVTELSIGIERIGATGGMGLVYFDDIRLYPLPEP